MITCFIAAVDAALIVGAVLFWIVRWNAVRRAGITSNPWSPSTEKVGAALVALLALLCASWALMRYLANPDEIANLIIAVAVAAAFGIVFLIAARSNHVDDTPWYARPLNAVELLFGIAVADMVLATFIVRDAFATLV